MPDDQPGPGPGPGPRPWWRRAWARLRADNPRWVLVLTALLLVSGTVYFFTVKVRTYHHTTQRISGDGRYYYAFLTSIVLDGDVDMKNQYANKRQMNPWGYRATETGKPANPFTVGPAIMWSPFFVLAHGVSLVAEPRAENRDGYSDLTQMLTLYGSFLYGAAAALLAYQMARRRYGPGAAYAGAVVGAVCGPVLQYMIHQPSFAHAPSAFAVALVLWIWDRGRRDGAAEDARARSLRGWLGWGAAIGLAMSVRQQNLVFALPAVVEGVRRVVAARGEGPRGLARAALAPAAGGLVALVCFAPQMIVWHSIYGYAFGVPQGATYMQWSEPAWSEVLFSGRNGLFVYAPLWLVGFFGLFVLARRERAVGAQLVAMFVLATWVNGAVTDWWAIGSIGARRFDGLLVPMAIGFAAVARAFLDAVERKPRVAGGVALAAVVALFGHCNYSFTDKFTRYDRLGEPDSRDTLAEYLGVVERDGKKLWRWGNPIALPAALAFSWRTGAPARAYDAVVGPQLLVGVTVNDFQTRPEKEKGYLSFVSPKHERFLTRGFGEVRKRDAADKNGLRVALGPRQRALVPLNNRGRVAVHLVGQAGPTATTLHVRWNEQEVAAVPLTPGTPIDVRLELSDTQAIRGVNILDLVHDDIPANTDAALYDKLELQSPP
jgi:hypothetical protein